MKDTLSYAVVSDGEDGLPVALRKFRSWLESLPERAKVRIVIKGAVKEAEEAAEMSKTSDMFKAGEVRDGVQRKGRGAGGRGKAKLASVPVDGAEGAAGE